MTKKGYKLITRSTWSQFGLTTSFLLLAFAQPNVAVCDVGGPPDTPGKDLAGAVLVLSNSIASVYFASSLQSESTSEFAIYGGAVFGAGSLAVGMSDGTSHSAAVALLGAATLVLSVANLIKPYGGPGPGSNDPNIVHRTSITPLVVNDTGERYGYGLAFKASF